MTAGDAGGWRSSPGDRSERRFDEVDLSDPAALDEDEVVARAFLRAVGLDVGIGEETACPLAEHEGRGRLQRRWRRRFQ
jgi:hypothetical protein